MGQNGTIHPLKNMGLNFKRNAVKHVNLCQTEICEDLVIKKNRVRFRTLYRNEVFLGKSLNYDRRALFSDQVH